MNLAASFFSTASADLSTAILLFQSKRYPESVYYLQQAVEKFTKALGIKSGMLDDSEVAIRKISHKSGKVFTRHIAASQTAFAEITDLEKLFPEFINSVFSTENGLRLSDYLAEFDHSAKRIINYNSDDFTWPDQEALLHIFSIIEATGKPVDLNVDDYKVFYPKFFNRLLTALNDSPNVKKEDIKELKKSQNLIQCLSHNMLVSFEKTIPKINFISSTLFLFSLILTGHNQSTRYPCLKCGETPEELYSEEELIIQQIPQFISILKTTERYLTDCFFPQ